jgi:hypothetical protein
VQRVIELINPILRGWVNYLGHGHAGRCFSYVPDWVEKKVRRHLARNSKRHGFGWKRWSKSWILCDNPGRLALPVCEHSRPVLVAMLRRQVMGHTESVPCTGANSQLKSFP